MILTNLKSILQVRYLGTSVQKCISFLAERFITIFNKGRVVKITIIYGYIAW